MQRTEGRPEVKIGLIDGPVSINHPDLPTSYIQEIPGKLRGRSSSFPPQRHAQNCLGNFHSHQSEQRRRGEMRRARGRD